MAISIIIDQNDVITTGRFCVFNGKKSKNDNPSNIKFFEYAVIKYIWTDENGLDLDTRTIIKNPPRNVVVGWSNDLYDEGYLTWSGDNTVSGVEAVLIDNKLLIQDYPQVEEFEIEVRAFWHNAKFNGDFKIKFESYTGGQMVSTDHFDWFNEGGEKVQEITINCHTDHTKYIDIVGELITTLKINTRTGVGKFVMPTPTDEQHTLRLLSTDNADLFTGTASKLKLINSANETIYEDL